MTVSLEVDNRQDLELLLLLVNRLGIRLIDKPVPTNADEKELKQALEIIKAGVDMPEERLHELMKQFEEDRQDRPLPFRNQ